MTEVTIPEFFRNQSVFITGGSGFIGKVLIEKLLRSCPDLKNVYLLMRAKKGKTPQERIESITHIPLFDCLRSQYPAALDKLKIINGDISELKLGISDSDWNLLIEEVNIIINAAASVRFDDPLAKAIFVNTRSAREIMMLASKIKKMQVLVHISTAYAHTDRKVIGEQLYPSHQNWKCAIEIAENLKPILLDQLTEKYIAPLQNTYTFAKSLAEHVIYDMGNGKFPAIIVRPSIVISSMHEPITGWIDNFNGPVSLLLACQKGIVKTFYSSPNTIADFVPVDVTVKAILIAAWSKGTIKDSSSRLETDFCNLTNNDLQSITYDQLLTLSKTISADQPLNNILWYPNPSVDQYYHIHLLKFLFYQLLPSMCLDGIIKICGYTPLLMRLQRRIYTANMSLQYFLENSWTFINDKVIKMNNSLHSSDTERFSFLENILSPDEFLKNAAMGSRRYLLKESDDTIEQAKKHSNRMYWASWLFTIIWYFGLIWLVFFKIEVVSFFANKDRRVQGNI